MQFNYITLSQINQGASLVYHSQRVAVYHQCEALYIIIAKAIQPSVDDMHLRWWYTPNGDDMPLLSQWINKKGTFGRQKFLFCWLREWDLNLTTFGLWARRAARLLHPAILWCRKPGSNRYEMLISRDFKSRASANSAIPAWKQTLGLRCSYIITLQNAFVKPFWHLFWVYFILWGLLTNNAPNAKIIS